MATALCAAAYWGHAAGVVRVPGLEALELVTRDARVVIRGERKPRSDDIVIVGLDDDTRRRAPEVFQRREGWAELLDGLAEYEPRAVAIDAMFSTPETVLPPEVVERVSEARDMLGDEPERTPAGESALAALDAVLETLRGDERLAEAIGGVGDVKLAVYFLLQDRDRGIEAAPREAAEHPLAAPARYGEAVVVGRPWRERPREAAASLHGSLREIAARAEGAGYVNVLRDADGVIRRVPAVIARAGRYYMPIGLSMALAATGERAAYVTGDPYVSAGDRKLPVGERADFHLSYLGPAQTFPHVSAADVLEGRASADALRDKLVFIGYTDTARDKDQAPFDAAYPGVEVHATLAHNVLFDELLRRAGPGAALGSIVGLGLLVSLFQLRRIRQRRAYLAVAAGLGAIALYVLAAHALLASAGLIVEVAAPSLSVVVVSIASLSAALATEGREKAKLKRAFSQYVAGALVERILADPSRAVLGGVRRELTVLFSDVRGFSEISEDLEPEVLSAFMNEYLTPMTDVVMREGGMLDKYIGDALMAVYGAPLVQRDHAERACQSAVAMLGALRELNAAWRARELPELAIGVGINSGPMSVGNMGSDARFDYTVLGDAVNLGARLEALTKEYGVQILCGERTAELATERFVFRELDSVRVKGRAGAVRIYELVGETDDAPLSSGDLDQFASALAAYREQRFDEAEDGFSAFLDRHPDDGPARVMLSRCRELRAQPPAPDWDGVYTQRSK